MIDNQKNKVVDNDNQLQINRKNCFRAKWTKWKQRKRLNCILRGLKKQKHKKKQRQKNSKFRQHWGLRSAEKLRSCERLEPISPGSRCTPYIHSPT